MKKSVVVKMQQDFEARPIANLVQVANRYESKIYLEHGDSRVNAKSIMGMMSLVRRFLWMQRERTKRKPLQRLRNSSSHRKK